MGNSNILDQSAVLQQLNTLLVRYKLISQHGQSVEMDTNDSTLCDGVGRSEQRNNKDSMPITFVQLWPVFEHLWMTHSANIWKCWLAGELSADVLSSFISYGIQFTGVSPVDIALYRTLTDDQGKVGLIIFLIIDCVKGVTPIVQRGL